MIPFAHSYIQTYEYCYIVTEAYDEQFVFYTLNKLPSEDEIIEHQYCKSHSIDVLVSKCYVPVNPLNDCLDWFRFYYMFVLHHHIASFVDLPDVVE